MENEECGEAFVVGVRKGRVREFGSEIAREGEGKRGKLSAVYSRVSKTKSADCGKRGVRCSLRGRRSTGNG